MIENFRPGVTRRLGIDYDAIWKARDDILYCSISGFGQTGRTRTGPASTSWRRASAASCG